MPIQDYNTDPNQNTSISGIDLAEGCAPAGINNAVRQLMADLAASSAKDPAKLRSADAGNAVALGSDGKLFIPSGGAIMLEPAALASSEAGNLITLGSDGRLFVNSDMGDTIPWDSVTGKPKAFSPTPHAASHLPGGSDPITYANIPAGLITLWKGSVAAIPSGWALCNGANGTPDLRDRFVLGAGGSVAPGASGGAASASVSGTTGPGGAGELASHSHAIPVAFSVSPNYSSGTTLCVQAGYAVQGSGLTGIGSTKAGSGASQATHTHTFSGSVATVPPYYALCYIMKL